MKNWAKLEDEKPEMPLWKYIMVFLSLAVAIVLAIIAHCNFYAPNYRALGLW